MAGKTRRLGGSAPGGNGSDARVVRHVAAGTALFRQGDPTFGFFRLVSGRIRLVRVTSDGTQVPMHSVRPGELFAEASLFAARYHCDAIATLPCEVQVFPKAQLLRRFRSDSAALWAFAAGLARHVLELRTRLELRQIRSARERVLQALTLRASADGLWKTDGTLKAFAEEIGLTHEALYRSLAGLERDARIARGKGEIRVLSGPRRAARRARDAH